MSWFGAYTGVARMLAEADRKEREAAERNKRAHEPDNIIEGECSRVEDTPLLPKEDNDA